MTPVLTQILFGTSSLLTVTHAESYLVGTIHDLQKRQLPVQGWALVEDACPSGTGTCGLRSCCPVGSFCDTDSFTNSNVCCPTRESCGYNIIKESRCALASWTLFTTSKDPMCCMPGEVAVNPTASESYGHCVGAGANVPVGSQATLIGTGGTTAPYGSVYAGPTPTGTPIATPLGTGTRTTATATGSQTAGSAASTSALTTNGGKVVGYNMGVLAASVVGSFLLRLL